MVEAKPESTVTPIGSLSLVREAKIIHEQRKDICQLEIPPPKSVIIQKGRWYKARHARLVILGEVLEFADITTFMGCVRSQLIRIHPIGSIVFPQALDSQLGTLNSPCEYQAGANTKLLTLNPEVMKLLEFSPEVICYIAHADIRTIQTLINHTEALEFDLRIASEERANALTSQRESRVDLEHAQQAFEEQQRTIAEMQKSLEYFESLCLRLQSRVDLQETASNSSVTIEAAEVRHEPESERPTNRQNPKTSILYEPDPDDGTVCVPSVIPEAISDEDVRYEGDGSDDADSNQPTLRPPSNAPSSDESNNQADSSVNKYETLREFPAAPDVNRYDDADEEPPRFTLPGPPPAEHDPDEGARMTITGVAPQYKPPRSNRPPRPLSARGKGLVVTLRTCTPSEKT